MKNSKFILVDHHVASPLTQMGEIIQIFDHRPVDANNCELFNNCDSTIQQVGSCATLIADVIRELEGSFNGFDEIITLLRGPIIFDTSNFSKISNKAKFLDVAIIEDIEKLLKLKKEDHLSLFENLLKAYNDFGSLTTTQLLLKDLKVIFDENKTHSVAIPVLPISVEVMHFFVFSV